VTSWIAEDGHIKQGHEISLSFLEDAWKKMEAKLQCSLAYHS
jgi:hypothetical protein